jgi:hypothetical protein
MKSTVPIGVTFILKQIIPEGVEAKSVERTVVRQFWQCWIEDSMHGL